MLIGSCVWGIIGMPKVSRKALILGRFGTQYVAMVTKLLSLGQMERQVVANGHNLNLCWMANINGLTSFLASTHKSQKEFKADYLLFHWLIIG